jgi:hypothetical protein
MSTPTTLREAPALDLPRITSLSLDFGVDDQECTENSVEITESAMHMRTRWCFELGTQIAVSFVCQDPTHTKRRLTANGVVVGCEECGDSPKTFQSTLLFLELPDDLKQCLRELSCRDRNS